MPNLEAKLLAVREEDAIGYGPRAIPSPLDQMVGGLVDAFIEASALERQGFRAAVDVHLSQILRAFAERMASLAVRQSSTDTFFKGLVALVAEGWAIDAREDLLVLSTLHDAAHRLGLDPAVAFRRVHPYATEAIAASLDGFVARSRGDKSLEAMGYRAGKDADGFRYERTW